MDSTIIYLLTWMFFMSILLWLMPNSKIKAITDFFSSVLPKIPITGIIKLLKKDKQRD